MAATDTLDGGGPPQNPQDGSGSKGSVSVGPAAQFNTALTHDVSPVQFAGLLTVLGLVWFTVPGDYHWLLTAALILGALIYANHVADVEGRVRPIILFSSVISGQGL